jgi:hypothetical protein
MTNAGHLKQALAKVGATLDQQSPDPHEYILDAPDGLLWNANGCHAYVIPFKNSGGQTWRPEALAEAAQVIAQGFERCTAVNCDMCVEAGLAEYGQER